VLMEESNGLKIMRFGGGLTLPNGSRFKTHRLEGALPISTRN
jgi:hypothetical protein